MSNPQFTRVFAPPTTAASFSCSVSRLCRFLGHCTPKLRRASARETMVTADSGSARDRHWKSWALGPPGTIQTHSPHSGDRRARPRPGKAAAGLHRRRGREPSSQVFLRVVSRVPSPAPLWSKLPEPERQPSPLRAWGRANLLVEGLGVGGGGRDVGVTGSLVGAGGQLELVGSLEVVSR